jgi:hypothetical protein
MKDCEEKPRSKRAETPPGDFLSDDLREETARFLDEVKRRIRKGQQSRQEPRLGPPSRRKTA